MTDYLGPVDPIKIETELGAIYLHPVGARSVNVQAPYLTVDGMPLQASAFLVRGGDNPENRGEFDFLRKVDGEGVSIAENALRARLVDGRSADLVTLGKIAQAIVPAVCRLAKTNKGFFLEAERRVIHNEILALEVDIESKKSGRNWTQLRRCCPETLSAPRSLHLVRDSGRKVTPRSSHRLRRIPRLRQPPLGMTPVEEAHPSTRASDI